MANFNARNKSLTAKLLQQGCRYHKLRKTFSKFYRRHYELVSKFNIGFKHFCIKAYRNRNCMLKVYKFPKHVGRAHFYDQFRKIIICYKRIGYNINILRHFKNATFYVDCFLYWVDYMLFPIQYFIVSRDKQQLTVKRILLRPFILTLPRRSSFSIKRV